jgi:hypothetical protein
MALQYGRHMLSVYPKFPGRASGRFLTNGCCACGWAHVQLRRSAMHAFAFAMCAIRTPAKTWGQGGQRAGEASGTQNPHIDPTWVLELIQCWEEMDREQSQNSSEP